MLLTPLILIAGLIAVVAAPAVIMTRRTGVRTAARRRPALTPVLHLEPSPTEPSAEMLSSRAA